MNKIYKVIWSKARHQYVVASELAKSVTKGAGSRIGRTAAAVLAAIVLTAGAGLPAQAADLTSTSTTYTLDLGLLGSYEINTPITVTTSGENVAASLEGQSLNLGGLTVSGTNVLTEAAMDGVVKWDDETDNSIHGVRFDGNGALSADSLSVAEDRFSVDKYGNIAAQTYGGEGDDTHYYFDMSHADGIQMGYSNGSSMNIDPFGVHFKVGEQETTINGNTIVTGRVNADTVQADNMYVGTQTPGHAVVTQDQLTDGIDTATEGMVKWDPVLGEDGQPTGEYNKDSIHGVELKDGTIHATGGGDNSINGTLTVGGYTTINADAKVQGQMTAAGYHNANDTFTVDENGNLKAAGGIVSGTVSQYAGGGIAIGEGSVTNGVYGVALGNGAQASGTNSTALGRSSSASGSDSVALGDYSVATEDYEVSLGRGTIGSNGYIARRLTHVADGINDDDAATVGQMNTAVGEATEGVVKWDTDAEGNYVDGSLRGMHFLGKDGIVTFGNENKVLINGTTGQIVADSMGANSIATKNLSAGNGAVTVDENGKLSTTGDVSMINSTGELVSLTDDRGLTMMTSGDHGTGMLTMDDGSISMMGGTNTIVTMDENGTTFGTLMGDEKTVISGNSITTGSVTGLTNTEWTGKAEDIVENRAATEGQLAALSDDLNASIGTATEGVVKWDEDGNGGYKEGYLTAEHQLSAGNGNLLVDEEGVHLKTPGEILGDAKDETNYYLDMTNEHGISMGYTGGTSMTITTQGVTFSAAGGNATHINGNSIATTDANGAPGGQISTGTVYASENMYIGDSQNPDNEVATKGDLNAAVGEATQNVVKYDDNGELHAGTENTGKLDLDKENGAASLTSGNGEHSLSVTNDGTSVTGGMAVEGGMLVSGGLTVDGSVQIANEDGSFSSLATSEDVSKVQEEVDQNTADIGKLNNKVGTGDITATDKDGNAYGNLTDAVNGNNSMIHENTSSISTIKDQIGGTGENGALNLANGQTTIEGGINYNYAAIQQQGQAINALGGRVHELGEEIDSVGAISSALAGLHPLDYDGTGSKFQLSAAMGTYDGTQAAAIGGFYHFNEDVMLSLGGATAFNGEHKTAANIGVTFRVGPGGSEKKPATPDEVMTTLDAMNRKIQEMDAKIAALEQDKKDLTEENQQLKAEAAEAVTAEAPAAEEQA